MINSALYHGEVMHQRFAPRQHRFTYQLTSWLIDIDELPQLGQNLKGFGWNKRALFSFIDTDYGFGDGTPARVFIDTMLKDFNLPRAHRVELLCQVRCLGFVFNPLAVWFCYDEQERLIATLYEVRNTFKQRHHYFVPETITPTTAEETTKTTTETTSQTHNQTAQETGHQTAPVYHHHRSEKNFYVSPFMPMDCQYEFRFQRPDAHLNLTIKQTSQGKPLMIAAWRGERQTLSQTALNRLAIRHPLSTLKIIFAIHWEAMRLWIKGMRLITRPAPPTHLVTRGQPINKRER